MHNWIANPEEEKTGRWQFMGWRHRQQHQQNTDIAERDTCNQLVVGLTH